MSVSSIASLLNNQAAQVIVSKLVPIGEFGFYGFASSTVNRATFITGAVAQAAFPSFASLHRAERRAALLVQYRKLQDLLCYGTVPLFAGVCFAALPVYNFIFNVDAAWLLMIPTALLSLATYLNGTTTIPYMLSVAVGRPDIGLRTNVIALVMMLPVTIALTYWLGLTGAALSMVFYNCVLLAYMVPRISRECLEIAPLSWYLHMARALAAAAVIYGAAWLAIVIPGGYSLIACVIGYAVATIGFAGAAMLLIGPELKGTLRSLPSAMRPVRPTPSR
jgi:O-antigen/teichoic acid export membrane protein